MKWTANLYTWGMTWIYAMSYSKRFKITSESASEWPRIKTKFVKHNSFLDKILMTIWVERKCLEHKEQHKRYKIFHISKIAQNVHVLLGLLWLLRNPCFIFSLKAKCNHTFVRVQADYVKKQYFFISFDLLLWRQGHCIRSKVEVQVSES
jgi:hypothetical protein